MKVNVTSVKVVINGFDFVFHIGDGDGVVVIDIHLHDPARSVRLPVSLGQNSGDVDFRRAVTYVGDAVMFAVNDTAARADIKQHAETLASVLRRVVRVLLIEVV